VFVRREEPDDVDGVRIVHSEAFADSTEVNLLDALRVSDAWIPELSFVARFGVGIAGHAVCTRAYVDERPVLAMGPVGVRPKFQGQGIGKALVMTAIGAADAMGEPLIGLLGDPRFYERFGFEVGAMIHIIPREVDWLTDFQVRRLHHYDPEIKGTFRFAAPFDEV
jgi:putative acetyltransferase